MHTSRKHDYLLTLCIANGQKGNVEAVERFRKYWVVSLLFQVTNHTVKLLESVGKGVGELYACVLVVSEKVGEAKLVGRLILVIDDGIGIGDSASSSAPLGEFLHIAVADLHSLAVETAAFAETTYDEMRFAPQALHAEVEPSRNAIWVSFPLQVDTVSIGSHHLHACQVATLEVTPENGTTDWNDLSTAIFHSL